MQRPAPRWIILAFLALLPVTDFLLPRELRIASLIQPIIIFTILGFGINVVTGYTGLLNLGVAAFMAIGAYTFAISTCDIYPFQIGFWPGLFAAIVLGAVAGVILGMPTLRLRGDYLAMVTLGFGEIVQDILKNLDTITQGTQGINPLPPASVFGFSSSSESYLLTYYILFAILAVVVALMGNLERSAVGRSFVAIREDELAARCMRHHPTKIKLLSFATGAGLAALAGALWASYLGSTGEPGNYDFQISILALCMIIVGGIGTIEGVLIGAIVMVGFNSIILVKLTDLLAAYGMVSSGNVLSSPGNWKYIVFGLALIVMMRLRPQGLLPTRTASALHVDPEKDAP
ncbi:MAG: hypothetical protein RL417_657 [Pseudomonadota bacterium]|jgi:branched-chain amino acid transport system permease protein